MQFSTHLSECGPIQGEGKGQSRAVKKPVVKITPLNTTSFNSKWRVNSQCTLKYWMQIAFLWNTWNRTVFFEYIGSSVPSHCLFFPILTFIWSFLLGGGGVSYAESSMGNTKFKYWYTYLQLHATHPMICHVGKPSFPSPRSGKVGTVL